jgi:hypothetical protein
VTSFPPAKTIYLAPDERAHTSQKALPQPLRLILGERFEEVGSCGLKSGLVRRGVLQLDEKGVFQQPGTLAGALPPGRAEGSALLRKMAARYAAAPHAKVIFNPN